MRGFTVFETLISILIFSIITLALGMAVVAGKNSLFTSDAPTQLRQDVLFAILSMSRELRQSASAQIINPQEGESSNSITFKIPRYNTTTGAIVWGQEIKYECNGCSSTVPGQLTRKLETGTPSVIAPNIILPGGKPLFDRKEIGLINIDINAKKVVGQKYYEDEETAKVKMRN